MHPFQVAAIVVLALGVIIYVWRGVKRGMRANEEFFSALIVRVSQVLQPKGFRLTRHVYRPKSFGHRIATFEGPASLVEVFLDGKEQDVRLTRTRSEEPNPSREEVLAGGYLGPFPTPADYTRVAAAIIDAAASIDGAA
jgi:hypothetical protein